MQDQTSGELTGWLAYLHVDDEAQVQRTALAIIKAFGGGQKQQTVDDEPVIDTTDPKFVEQFKGFTHAKPGRPNRPPTSTQILMG